MLVYQKIGCPSCGAPCGNKKTCEFCGGLLSVTSIDEVYSLNLDSAALSNALEKWRKKIHENPNDAEAHYALGITYLNNKMFDEAVHHFSLSASIMPEVSIFHYTLAASLFDDGRVSVPSPAWDKIKASIDRAINLDPKNNDYLAFMHYIRGWDIRGLDYSDDEGLALQEFCKAASLSDKVPYFQNELGEQYAIMGDNAKAVEHYKKAIELGSRNCVTYANCALYSSLNIAIPMDQCMSYINDALDLIDSRTRAEDVCLTYDVASTFYEIIGEIEKSIQFRDKAIAIIDSASRRDTRNRLLKILNENQNSSPTESKKSWIGKLFG